MSASTRKSGFRKAGGNAKAGLAGPPVFDPY